MHLVVLRHDDGGRLMETCKSIITTDRANEGGMMPVGSQSHKTFLLGKMRYRFDTGHSQRGMAWRSYERYSRN
jgi:hypothetical protein